MIGNFQFFFLFGYIKNDFFITGRLYGTDNKTKELLEYQLENDGQFWYVSFHIHRRAAKGLC